MLYIISRNKWGQEGLFSITDDSGAPQFQVLSGRSRKLCSTSGEELAAISLHPFRHRSDITRSGQLIASVHPVGLGMGEKYRVSGPAGEFNAAGDFFGHRYTMTRAGGSLVATVSQRPSFREVFDVEIDDGEDPVFLLAVIVAVEVIRDNKGQLSGG